MARCLLLIRQANSFSLISVDYLFLNRQVAEQNQFYITFLDHHSSAVNDTNNLQWWKGEFSYTVHSVSIPGWARVYIQEAVPRNNKIVPPCCPAAPIRQAASAASSGGKLRRLPHAACQSLSVTGGDVELFFRLNCHYEGSRVPMTT
jgi:hypothetical protein